MSLWEDIQTQTVASGYRKNKRKKKVLTMWMKRENEEARPPRLQQWARPRWEWEWGVIPLDFLVCGSSLRLCSAKPITLNPLRRILPSVGSRSGSLELVSSLPWIRGMALLSYRCSGAELQQNSLVGCFSQHVCRLWTHLACGLQPTCLVQSCVPRGPSINYHIGPQFP